jgi:murein DD-endopeptidase MepM/ murein hydrolase activator NlpD
MRTFTSLRRRALAGSAIAIVLGAMTATSASAHESTRVSLDAQAGDAIASMDCPLDGDSQFSDSWGDSRSGGRRHEGVDMLAERGTPVVAALAGFAEFKNTRAGGKSVWLTTSSGDKFFYAHLDEWEGESREVAQGELVGRVGSTGNAGGPHLHFEVRPGGRVVNPYPPTAAACAPDVEHDQSVAPEVGSAGSTGRLLR